MENQISIGSVMTKSPHSIGPEQDITLVKAIFQKHHFRHLPVQDAGRLLGVISDRDLNNALKSNQTEDKPVRVQDIYTQAYIVDASTNLDEVITNMIENEISCSLVTVYGDELVGIFTTTDAYPYLTGQRLR